MQPTHAHTCCPVQIRSKLSKPAALKPCPGAPPDALPSAKASIQLISCTADTRQRPVYSVTHLVSTMQQLLPAGHMQACCLQHV